MSKINVDAIKDHAERNYYKIANIIRSHGTPNSQFPSDKDIPYSQLRELADGISGLGTILKNMKLKVRSWFLPSFLSNLIFFVFFFFFFFPHNCMVLKFSLFPWQQMVDYRDPFIKDETTITLIEDYFQSFCSQFIRYEEITSKIESGETTGHMRSVAAEENSQ